MLTHLSNEDIKSKLLELAKLKIKNAQLEKAEQERENARILRSSHPIDRRIRLNQEITEEIDRNFANTIVQDLVPVQPLDLPLGILYYLDYVYSEPKDPTVYDNGSWSMGNTFEGVIGIKSEIKPHTFI